MDVTLSLPDEFVERVRRCGTSPEDYVKLLFDDAMRRARIREANSRPEDTQKFLDEWAAESKADMQAEMLQNEATAKAEAKRKQQEQQAPAATGATEQTRPSAPPT